MYVYWCVCARALCVCVCSRAYLLVFVCLRVGVCLSWIVFRTISFRELVCVEVLSVCMNVAATRKLYLFPNQVSHSKKFG